MASPDREGSAGATPDIPLSPQLPESGEGVAGTSPPPEPRLEKSEGGRKRGRSEGASGYDDDTVRTLLRCMKEAGYGDRRKQKKSLKEVFQAAVRLAKDTEGIDQTAKGWQKKFNRLKQDY